jgi:hypothetical protein
MLGSAKPERSYPDSLQGLCNQAAPHHLSGCSLALKQAITVVH